jgi:hypothetical protein
LGSHMTALLTDISMSRNCDPASVVTQEFARSHTRKLLRNGQELSRKQGRDLRGPLDESGICHDCLAVPTPSV